MQKEQIIEKLESIFDGRTVIIEVPKGNPLGQKRKPEIVPVFAIHNEKT